MPPTPVDLLIIGAGPTGLFATFYAGLREMSIKLVDSLPTLGGQLATLYPEKYIFDAPGHPRILARDLVQNLTDQAMTANPTLCLDQSVQTLTHDPAAHLYTVSTSKSQHTTRTILIAAGVGAFTPRTLDVRDADRFVGRGVHYFVRSPDDFRGRRVLIVGGGDSAVDWANTLAPVAAHQTLIHRSDRFRAHEQSVRQLLAGPTDVRTFHELDHLAGDDRVRQASIYDNRSNEHQTLDVDAVLVNVGFVSNLGPIKHWDLELQGGQIVVDATRQTNRPGVFAAGDVAAYPGKIKLIATGFADAATAVNFAKHLIDPKANVFPGHSTNLRR